VLLYSVALFLEFGALIRLRKCEPALRGVFRIPLGRPGIIVLAGLPMLVLAGVVIISFRDGEYGLPALVGAIAAMAAGPIVSLVFGLAQNHSEFSHSGGKFEVVRRFFKRVAVIDQNPLGQFAVIAIRFFVAELYRQ